MFVAEGFRVIRFDNRDVGLSTHFDDVTPDLAAVLAALGAGDPPPLAYTLADMAADVIAVLDDLGVDTRARDGPVDGRDDRAARWPSATPTGCGR